MQAFTSQENELGLTRGNRQVGNDKKHQSRSPTHPSPWPQNDEEWTMLKKRYEWRGFQVSVSVYVDVSMTVWINMAVGVCGSLFVADLSSICFSVFFSLLFD